jgi:hypothetical protein
MSNIESQSNDEAVSLYQKSFQYSRGNNTRHYGNGPTFAWRKASGTTTTEDGYGSAKFAICSGSPRSPLTRKHRTKNRLTKSLPAALRECLLLKPLSQADARILFESYSDWSDPKNPRERLSYDSWSFPFGCLWILYDAVPCCERRYKCRIVFARSPSRSRSTTREAP